MSMRRTASFEITRSGATFDSGVVNLFGTLTGLALAGIVIWSLAPQLERVVDLFIRL